MLAKKPPDFKWFYLPEYFRDFRNCIYQVIEIPSLRVVFSFRWHGKQKKYNTFDYKKKKLEPLVTKNLFNRPLQIPKPTLLPSFSPMSGKKKKKKNLIVIQV
jgi:hypothetical protein